MTASEGEWTKQKTARLDCLEAITLDTPQDTIANDTVRVPPSSGSPIDPIYACSGLDLGLWMIAPCVHAFVDGAPPLLEVNLSQWFSPQSNLGRALVCHLLFQDQVTWPLGSWSCICYWRTCFPHWDISTTTPSDFDSSKGLVMKVSGPRGKQSLSGSLNRWLAIL